MRDSRIPLAEKSNQSSAEVMPAGVSPVCPNSGSCVAGARCSRMQPPAVTRKHCCILHRVTMLNSGGVIGVSTDPWGYGVGDLRQDGVTIDTGTLPGSW